MKLFLKIKKVCYLLCHLVHLKNLGISYIFGGKEVLNFTAVVEKLKSLFSIDQLILEGGGSINGSF